MTDRGPPFGSRIAEVLSCLDVASGGITQAIVAATQALRDRGGGPLSDEEIGLLVALLARAKEVGGIARMLRDHLESRRPH